MFQTKTLKICANHLANHLVVLSITMQEQAGNDKSCDWHASDFSDGELKEETFCIRFGTVENCRQFREMFEEIAQSQETKEESKDASAATKLIEQLRVSESNAQSEEAAAAATPTAPLASAAS